MRSKPTVGRAVSPTRFCLLALILIVAAGTTGSGAAPGIVDTTFDTDGRQTVDFNSDDRAHGVVVQPDGKVVVAGFTTDNNDFAVARLNPNGSLDLTFSTDGKFSPTFGGVDKATAVALQTDGKIVVVGYTNFTGVGANDFAVARVNVDGTPDLSFDADGEMTVDFGFDDRAMGVAIQDDGKIVVAGFEDGGTNVTRNFAIARLNTNGSLDVSFSGDGKFDPTLGGADFGQAVALQSNGSIIVAGYTSAGGGAGANDFGVVRITTDGILDVSFDTDGRQTVDFGSDDRSTGVVVQPDGRIVAGGFTSLLNNFAVARLNSNGALDATFSGDGKFTNTFGGVDVARGVALQHNGKIVMGGETTIGGGVGATNFAIAVVNPDGTPDTSFDTDGELIVDMGGDDVANAVALQPDGQIVLAGFTNAGINNFALLRVGADPPLDLTFDGDGRQTTSFGDDDRGNAVVIQPDGKVVVAGSWDGGASDFAIARYNVNGTLDATFSGDGRQNLTFGPPPFGGAEFANAVALQADGKIVVAGYTDAGGGGGPNNFGVARLNPNGTLDTTFDTDGKLTIDFGADDRANGVAIQEDGKIVIVGSFDGGSSNFAVARLNPNGSLDTTFDTDGRGTYTFLAADFATSVVIQPDGRIVVGGYTNQPGTNDFALIRILTTGALDTSFDTDGKVTTSFGDDDRVRSLALQLDGKIVAAGAWDGGQSDFAIARYTAAGALDPTFSVDGRQNLTFGAGIFGGAEFGRGVAIQPNGKLVVAGFSDAGSALGPNDFALVRLNSDGALDTTFNVTGKLLIDFGNDDRAHGVAINPATGAIVAAGFTSRGDDFAVLRLPGDVPPALPSLTVNDVTVLEGNAGSLAATFTVTLSAASVFPVTVDVATANVSAVGPGDYTPVTTSLLFTPGTTSRTVTVDVTGDVLDEPVETFAVNLTNAGNATIADAQGIGTINDNDLTVTITSPTTDPAFAGNTSFLTLGGTAADAVGIQNVTWVSDRGGSGTATGTTSWTIPSVPILAGVNVITVTARDVAGNTTTDTITVTLSTLVYYLAEGATGPFFDYDLLLANPNAVVAPVAITFLRDDGVTVPITRNLPARSRTTIRVDDVAGLSSTAVSTVVTSTNALPIVVERSMYWDSTYYGGHAGSSVPLPATNWLFGEGSQGFFDTYVLLANSNAAAVNVTVRFLLEVGAPVVKTYTVGATSRFNVYAGAIPELVGQSFSIVVESSAPIIAERAMYFGSPLFNGGHESAGVNAASTTWFHAEGATGSFFDTYILVGNPNAGAATVTMTFLRDTGATVVKTKIIPGNSRLTVNVESEDPQLADTAVSTTVTSDLPVISERAMYWPGPFTSWFEAHNSFGVTDTGTKWGLAEGRVGGPFSFQTYILLANPSTTTAANVTITYLKTDGTTVVKNYTVNATTRFNVDVNAVVPELAGLEFSVIVEVTNGIPIAVERALYNDSGGVVWAAGTNATAVRIP